MPRTVMVKLAPEKLRISMTDSVLPISEVAKRAGISTATVRRAIYGRAISAISARSIARALGTPVMRLIADKLPHSDARTSVAV